MLRQFYQKSDRHIAHSGNILVYLVRYLMANKSYLINTIGLCAVACFLPLLFGEFNRLNILSLGFAILCLNTPICTLLSCDPDLEQTLLCLVLPAYLFCQWIYRLYLFVQLAAYQWRNQCHEHLDGCTVRPAKRYFVDRFGMGAPYSQLEKRK